MFPVVILGEIGAPAAASVDSGWSISAVKVLLVLAGALCVFAAIRATRGLAATIAVSRVWRARFERFGPITELFTWSIFAAIAIAWLLEGHQLATIILLAGALLVVIIAGFFSIRDYFAGVIVRVERFARVGDEISVDGVVGRVVSLGSRTLELETDEGDVVLLPYSGLGRHNIIRRQRAGIAPRHTFTVKLPQGMDASHAEQLAYDAIILNHWAAPRHDPTVRVIDPQTLRLTVQPVVAARSDELEGAVRAVLAKRSDPTQS